MKFPKTIKVKQIAPKREKHKILQKRSQHVEGEDIYEEIVLEGYRVDQIILNERAGYMQTINIVVENN